MDTKVIEHITQALQRVENPAVVAFNLTGETFRYYSIELTTAPSSLSDVISLLKSLEVERAHCTLTLRIRDGSIASVHQRRTEMIR